LEDKKETFAWGLSLFLAFFIVYTKFMSYDFNFDGIVFANVLEHPSAEGLFHGNWGLSAGGFYSYLLWMRFGVHWE
jgi:hypothetical protein